MCDVNRLRQLNPGEVRTYLGDGNYGGYYQRSDDEMLAIWRAGVEETRALLAEPWG
jgi:creatinine amidohydrolase